MKIHCVCIVRDEADILPFTLNAALTWADAIYVCDNGSTDGTWGIIQDYARRYPQVVCAGRVYGTFHDSLRGPLANRFLGRARRGDWWCRLDADEIYAEDPRQFLARVPRRYKVVYAICVNYLFTDVDLALYEKDPNAYIEEWTPQRLRFYTTNYSDVRFVRHIPGLEWTSDWPDGVWEMRPYQQRILMRHYDYRSPPQIERRIHIRTKCTQVGSFSHERMSRWAPMGFGAKDVVFSEPDGMEGELWRSRIVRSTALYRDDADEPLRINWKLVPPIWKPLPLYVRWGRPVRRFVSRLLGE
jgi:glycosyltransferase involved in cell wall biosynthesis